MAESSGVRFLSSTQRNALKSILYSDVTIFPKEGNICCCIKPIELIKSIYDLCKASNVNILDVRLIGGAAAYVVGYDEQISTSFNDLDFNVITDCDPTQLHDVKAIVFTAFAEYLKTRSVFLKVGPGGVEPLREENFVSGYLESSTPFFVLDNAYGRPYMLPPGYPQVDLSPDINHISPINFNSINHTMRNARYGEGYRGAEVSELTYANTNDTAVNESNFYLPDSSKRVITNEDVEHIHDPQNDADVIKESISNSIVRGKLISYSADYICKCYTSKLLRVATNEECWSLYGFGSIGGSVIDIKFVKLLRREYEFSVDSFQIGILFLLDNFYSYSRDYSSITTRDIMNASNKREKNFNDAMADVRMIEEDFEKLKLTIEEKNEKESSVLRIDNENDIIPALCVMNDYIKAFNCLKNKTIFTHSIEDIHGGGLLKYCLLIAKNYAPDNKTSQDFERKMCSKFFADLGTKLPLSDKLARYLSFHMAGDDVLQYRFLLNLYLIIRRSALSLHAYQHFIALDTITGLLMPLSIKLSPHIPQNLSYPSYDQNFVKNHAPPRYYLGSQYVPFGYSGNRRVVFQTPTQYAPRIMYRNSNLDSINHGNHHAES